MGEHKTNKNSTDKREWNEFIGGEQAPLTGESLVIGAELMAYGYNYICSICGASDFEGMPEEEKKHFTFVKEAGLDVVKQFGAMAKYLMEETEKDTARQEGDKE